MFITVAKVYKFFHFCNPNSLSSNRSLIHPHLQAAEALDVEMLHQEAAKAPAVVKAPLLGFWQPPEYKPYRGLKALKQEPTSTTDRLTIVQATPSAPCNRPGVVEKNQIPQKNFRQSACWWISLQGMTAAQRVKLPSSRGRQGSQTL